MEKELYTDEFTRKTNGLLFKMRKLFNEEKVSIWEFQQLIRITRSYCKEYDLYFDEEKEMVYRKK